ncbi:hypothetical protein FKM82_030749 [Ascaphus truei]
MDPGSRSRESARGNVSSSGICPASIRSSCSISAWIRLHAPPPPGAGLGSPRRRLCGGSGDRVMGPGEGRVTSCAGGGCMTAWGGDREGQCHRIISWTESGGGQCHHSYYTGTV